MKTEGFKYNKLNKRGKKIKSLMRKYKDGEKNVIPRFKEPYRTPFDVLKENTEPTRECEECKGRIIKPAGGSWVCEECGLVYNQIFDDSFKGDFSNGDGDYRGVRESPYRKRRRHEDHNKWVHNKMVEKTRVLLEILREVRDKLKTYCKKNKLVQWKFVSEVILEAILPKTIKDAENYE